VQITLRAPGWLQFQNSNNSRVITYDGSQRQTKSSNGDKDDLRILESPMARLPDGSLLQLATGGSPRASRSSWWLATGVRDLPRGSSGRGALRQSASLAPTPVSSPVGAHPVEQRRECC